MRIIGIILLLVGIILFFVQKYQKERWQSVQIARKTTAAELNTLSQEISQEVGRGHWRDYVKAMGIVRCDRPLISQLSQTPCVYYEMKIVREYEEDVTRTNSQGQQHRETQRGSEVVSSNTRFVNFDLEDDTGKVAVNPSGADIDAEEVLDEFRPGTPGGGMISFGDFSLAIGENINNGRRRTIGYRYIESVLALDQFVFILAAANDSSGTLTLQKPTKGSYKYVISRRSEEEVATNAQNAAQIAFYSMVGCAVVGVALLFLGR